MSIAEAVAHARTWTTAPTTEMINELASRFDLGPDVAQTVAADACREPRSFHPRSVRLVREGQKTVTKTSTDHRSLLVPIDELPRDVRTRLVYVTKVNGMAHDHNGIPRDAEPGAGAAVFTDPVTSTEVQVHSWFVRGTILETRYFVRQPADAAPAAGTLKGTFTVATKLKRTNDDQKPKVPARAAAAPRAKVESSGDAQGRKGKYTVGGRWPVTAFLRRAGFEGVPLKDAPALLAELGVDPLPSKTTISIQVREGAAQKRGETGSFGAPARLEETPELLATVLRYVPTQTPATADLAADLALVVAVEGPLVLGDDDQSNTHEEVRDVAPAKPRAPTKPRRASKRVTVELIPGAEAPAD